MLRHGYWAVITPLLLLATLNAGCKGSEGPADPHEPHEPHAPDGANEAPRFSWGPVGSVAEVTAGSFLYVNAVATDPEGGPLTYAWTQEPAEPAGTFSKAAASTSGWTAPEVTQETNFTLKLRVSDAEGASVEGWTPVRVLKRPPPPPPPYTPPTLREHARATPSSVFNQAPVQLSVLATTHDGSPVTYSWWQSPQTPAGTFSDAQARTPIWTPPAVTAPTTFTLEVWARNNKDQSAQSSVEVRVVPCPTEGPNTAPTAETPTAPATAVSGWTIPLDVQAADPEGDALTYEWRQTAPAEQEQGTFMSSNKDTPKEWWIPPAVGAETDFTLEVTVRDCRGSAVTRSLTVTVRPTRASEVQFWWSWCTHCHGPHWAGPPAGGLDLSKDPYAALVEVQAQSSCTTMMRVKKGDPDNSVLVRKLEGTTCGTRMPQSTPDHPFTAHPGLRERLRSWILAGAQNN